MTLGSPCPRARQHPPTWQEEERAAIVTRPVPVLGLQPHVKRHPIQSPLVGSVGFGQVFEVTRLQKKRKMRSEGVCGQAEGALITYSPR